MKLPCPKSAPRSNGFSRIDLIAVLGIGCVLSLIALPPLARAGVGRQNVGCVENLRRLAQAWQLYAQDNGDRLVNNFGVVETMATISSKKYETWAHNILDWTLNPANTNQSLLRESRLFPYLDHDLMAFKCDADTYLSGGQQRAGWVGRVRSYSMNGFLGPSSGAKNDPSYRGENPFVPGYRQFLLTSSIPNPSQTSVFLDEHPDSINDGIFLNNPMTSTSWLDFPGAQHDGGAGIVYADGSAEIHHWDFSSTRRPVRFTFPPSAAIPSAERGDFRWLAQRLAVVHGTLGITPLPDNQLRIIWSQNPATFVLQSAPRLDSSEWTAVGETPQRAQGQSVVTLTAPSEPTVYRLFRP